MVSLELLLIAVILLVQPLVALLWGLLLFRLGVSFTAERTGAWFDNRVQTVREELGP
jgi:hypothetical protein